jgi:hypothetical protein
MPKKLVRMPVHPQTLRRSPRVKMARSAVQIGVEAMRKLAVPAGVVTRP